LNRFTGVRNKKAIYNYPF